MAKDVYVKRIVLGGRWPVIGEAVVYAKMHQVIIDDGCLHIYRKKYPSLPYDATMVHEVSIPLSTVWEWRVEEVD